MTSVTEGEDLRQRFDAHRELPVRKREGCHLDRPGTNGPALWAANEAISPALYGQYPQGFVAWATTVMGVDRHRVLHVCSGALPRGEGLVRVDIEASRDPDVVADGRALPFPSSSFDAVMIDPPYTMEYSRALYNTSYPRPSALLAEAARVARADAPIGFLHFLVPKPPVGATIERVYGVTTGCGYRIRAFTVFRRRSRDLFDA